MSSLNVIRLAMVGCGLIATHHLKAIGTLNIPRPVVTALVDPDIKAAQAVRKLIGEQEAPCQVFASIEEANKSDSYDAAIICVPHSLHEQCAMSCLDAGKHVLLEKPVAHTVESCVRLMNRAAETDKVFMVGENSRFWPEVERAVQLIKDGIIGEVYHARANYWEAIGNSFSEREEGEWINDPSMMGGGILMGGTSHWIRPLRLFVSDIKEVVGMISYPQKEKKAESLASAILRFDNGLPGTLHSHINNIPMAEIPFFQIFGSKGEVTIHGRFEGGITYRSLYHPEVVSTEMLGGYMASFPPQMKHFIELIKKGVALKREDGGSVWEATKEVLVSKAIYKSVQTRQWEEVMVENLSGMETLGME